MTTQFVKLGETGLDIDHSPMVVESDRDQLERMTTDNPALRYIIEYGWKQTLKDKLAGYLKKYPNTTVDVLLALMQKKYDAIIAGTVSMRDGGTRIVDPVLREARRIATLAFKDDYTDQERKVALTRYMQANGCDDKVATKGIITMLAATDDMIATARRNLSRGTPKVDLTQLMGVDDDSDNESDDDNS